MKDTVAFRSDLFRPILPESCQANPGRYGFELAFWLCSEFAIQGIVTSYPNHEDWGWFLEFTTNGGDEFWLCCGNTDGTDDEWQCFLKPLSKGFFSRSKPDTVLAKPLMDGLKLALENSGISDIEWSTELPY